MTQALPEIKVDCITFPKADGKIKALVDVVLGGHYVTKGLKVVEASRGVFVSMPGVTEKDGRFSEKFYPITKEAREILHSTVLEAYRNRVKVEALAGKTMEACRFPENGAQAGGEAS